MVVTSGITATQKENEASFRFAQKARELNFMGEAEFNLMERLSTELSPEKFDKAMEYYIVNLQSFIWAKSVKALA